MQVSALVEEEISRGDTLAAERRIAWIEDIPSLVISDQATALAELLLAQGAVPKGSEEDALHIGIAAAQGVDYLLMWNFKHINNAEAIFRSTKSLLETRPIFHKCDAMIRGHVFCSFLALVLRKALQDRLTAHGHALEWAQVIEDLEALQEIDVVHHQKHFRLRTEARGSCGKVFQAVGVVFRPCAR